MCPFMALQTLNKDAGWHRASVLVLLQGLPASFCWTADGASASMHEAGCATLALLHRAVLLHMFHQL